MKNVIILFCSLFILSCGGNSSEGSGGMTDSKMQAEVGDQSYEVDVRYYLDDDSGLTVYSDQNDVTDSNGDGLIFAIFEYNGKLQFDFVKDGERLGGKITDWKKTDNSITGNGELKPENGLGQGTPVSFELKL